MDEPLKTCVVHVCMTEDTFTTFITTAFLVIWSVFALLVLGQFLSVFIDRLIDGHRQRTRQRMRRERRAQAERLSRILPR